jgi:hypothetical protein
MVTALARSGQASDQMMAAPVRPRHGYGRNRKAMTTQHRSPHHRRIGLVAAALLGAVAVTACSSGFGARDSGGTESTTPESTKPLTLGQPSPEEQEISRYGKTGTFLITPEKVVEGTQQDLRQLGDDAKYANKKVVWVYVNAKQIGGQPVKGPMVMTDIGAETAKGGKAARLILIGDLSSRPKDCAGEDLDATWRRGDSRTSCAPYLVPADAQVTKVTYFQGYYNEPLAWAVP